jgi:hypothetical protein
VPLEVSPRVARTTLGELFIPALPPNLPILRNPSFSTRLVYRKNESGRSAERTLHLKEFSRWVGVNLGMQTLKQSTVDNIRESTTAEGYRVVPF